MSKGRRVLIVGVGGLGSPVALALAESAAIAKLTLIDPDRVELSNLHRQLLLRDGDLGMQKASAAADTLRARRPRARARARGDGMELVPLARKLSHENAAKLFREHDLIIEGSDDLHTKFLVNDYALALRVPAVIGGVVRFAGQVLTVWPGAACYRCLFEAPPEAGLAVSCQQAGVLGPACGVVAGIMADEALRIISGGGGGGDGDGGEGPRLAGTLLSLDLHSWQLRRVAIGRRSDCSACFRAAATGENLDSAEARP